MSPGASAALLASACPAGTRWSQRTRGRVSGRRLVLGQARRAGLRPPCPYLAPSFFFEKVFLTWRWRLLSSKAAKPPLSSVTDSSALERPLPEVRAGK